MEIKTKQRIALSTFFFISGVDFASWASRIPTIKSFYNLNDAELGTILLALPISSLIGLPISGWLMTKYESRYPMIIAIFALSIALCFIGFSSSIAMLVIGMCLFAFFMRIFNIAVNTQSINLQKLFKIKENKLYEISFLVNYVKRVDTNEYKNISRKFTQILRLTDAEKTELQKQIRLKGVATSCCNIVLDSIGDRINVNACSDIVGTLFDEDNDCSYVGDTTVNIKSVISFLSCKKA